MNRIVAFILSCIFILSPLLYPAAAARAEDKVVEFASNDPEMNAAIAKARASLRLFWEKFAHPGAGEASFTVKLGIAESANTEHFWCGSMEGTAAKATCEIDNEPQVVHSVKQGQRVEVVAEQISDWMYQRDGKIVGGETIRVIIPALPKDEADYYRSLLANPGPDG